MPEPKEYRNCRHCGAVLDDKRECPTCGRKMPGPKPGFKRKLTKLLSEPAGPPAPSPAGVPAAGSAPPFDVKVTINLTVDCSDPKSVDAFRHLMNLMVERDQEK